MIRSYRQRKVDRVVKDAYWDGFFTCLAGDESPRSAVGIRHLNECRQIAWKAGVEYCLEILAKRKEGLFRVDRDIPGRVYAEAYGPRGSPNEPARVVSEKNQRGSHAVDEL